MKVFKWLKIIPLVLLISCGVKDFYRLPLFSDNHILRAVIEIPAGTNHYIEYCEKTHRFKLQSGHQNTDLIRYLSYPFNFGFIPSTSIVEKDKDPGKAIDVIVLSETLQTGEVLEIVAAGLITIQNDNGSRHIVVAVPYDKRRRTIDAENLKDLNEKFAGITMIIQEWLQDTNPGNKSSVISWQDEIMASKLIDTWAVK